jgi:hypothetical protein
LEPNSLKRDERDEVSMAAPSVCASVEVAVAGAAGVVATGASVLEAGAALEVRGVLGALVSLAGVAATVTGAGATAEAVGAGEEEVFFAILSWYTLIGEVFLSIFRRYILYLAFLLKKESYYRHNFQ